MKEVAGKADTSQIPVTLKKVDRTSSEIGEKGSGIQFDN